MSNFNRLEQQFFLWDKKLNAWLKQRKGKTPKQKKKEFQKRCARIRKSTKNYVSPAKWQEKYEKAFKNTLGLARKWRIVLKMYFTLQQDWGTTKAYVNKRYSQSIVKERMEWIRKLNYVFTFTYDDKKHSESSFCKELRRTLAKLGWQYIGVWKRGSSNRRLYFYAAIRVPDGGMVGMNVITKEYQRKIGRKVKVIKNTYFSEKFGATVVNPLHRENGKLWRIFLSEINKKRAHIETRGIDKATFIGDYSIWIRKKKQQRKT